MGTEGDSVTIFTPLEKVLLWLVVALMVSASIGGWLWQHERGKTRAAAFRADSLAAAMDTSHFVRLSRKDSIILGDSLQAVGRRVFQIDQHNDAFDRALGLQRAAIAELAATVRDLKVSVSSSQPVVIDPATGDRSASFTIRPDSTKPTSPPYSGTAAVTLPPAGVGRLDLALSLPPARLGLRLGCGEKTDGIRSASATLTGPPWLQLSLGRIEQTPELCNPTNSSMNWLKRLLSRCGAGPAAALILAEDGKPHFGFGGAAACYLL